MMYCTGYSCNGWSCEVHGFSIEVYEPGKGRVVYYSSGACLYHASSEQVAGIMDQFERQFEHLDVQTQTMEEAMSGVTTLAIPEVSPLSLVSYHHPNSLPNPLGSSH